MADGDDITRYRFFAELKALPFVEAIYLYGSRARGDNFLRSDFDLAISAPEAEAVEWRRVAEILEQSDTLFTCDITRYDTLEEGTFKQRIDRDKVLLYSKKEDKMDAIWKDSFSELGKAIDRLQEVLEEPLDAKSYVLDAAIQRFEFTIELFWKTLKRMLANIAGEDTPFPKLAFQAAYRLQWIDEEKLWLSLLDDRNLSSHVYSLDQAMEIYQRLGGHYQLMRRSYDKLKALHHA